MKIVRIEVVGLKGAPVDVRIDGPTAFVGPNGSGKSRVLDAVAFALGRPVAGVAGSGPDLQAAVMGDVCAVTLYIDDGAGNVTTLARSRSVDAKTGAFSRPRVTIDGVQVSEDDVVAKFGPVGVPGGADWLTMSRDKLLATLGSIGAATDDGRMAVETVAPKVEAVVGAMKTSISSPVAWIAEARDAANAAANEAKKAARVADDSAEISRKAAADAGNVNPDRLRNLEATRDEAQRVLDGAVRVHADKVAEARGASNAVVEWERARARIASDVQAASVTARSDADALSGCFDHANTLAARIAKSGGPRSLDDIEAELQAVAADSADATAALRGAEDDAADARRSWQEKARAASNARSAADVAKARYRDVLDTVGVLESGCCPTCRREVTGDVMQAFTRTVLGDAVRVMEQADADADRADADVTVISQSVRDCDEYIASLHAQVRDGRDRVLELTREADAVRNLATSRANVESHAARAERSAAAFQAKSAELQTMDARRPKANADAERDAMSAGDAVDAARAALQLAQAAFDGAQQAAAKHTRHRDDLARRDAARTRKEQCDNALAAVRAVEESLSTHGMASIARDADPFIPRAFGRIDLQEGEIGLCLPGGAFVSGAGLSGAQRTAMTTAIDRAMESTRPLRVMLLEADAMTGETLREVAEGAVEAYWSESVGTVLIATCHDPGAVDGLTVVYTGDAPPPRGPGLPQPDVHVGVSPEVAAAVIDQAIGEISNTGLDVAKYANKRVKREFFAEITITADTPAVDPVGTPDVPPDAVDAVLMSMKRAQLASAMVAVDMVRDEKIEVIEGHIDRLVTPADPPDLRPHPAATAQPDLFAAVKLPDFLAKPGRTMLARKPDPAHVAKVAAGLSSEAAHYLREWTGRGAEPGPRPDTSAVEIMHELVGAEILSDDPFDCRLTFGGVEVWRLIHCVDPVRSDAEAQREDRPAPTGAGATEAEIEAAMKAAKLGAEALRYMGLTRAGLDTATKRSASIWRRHIVRALCQRGASVDDVHRWAAEAAEKHPKKTKATDAPGDDEADDDGTAP